jgi:hypothetical protein
MAPVSPPAAPSFLMLAYPFKLCGATFLTTWILSLITGNVSQVDRIWTFMPTIYTAYFALIPFWPRTQAGWTWLFPTLNPVVTGPAFDEYSPRALLMFFLTVRGSLLRSAPQA